LKDITRKWPPTSRHASIDNIVSPGSAKCSQWNASLNGLPHDKYSTRLYTPPTYNTKAYIMRSCHEIVKVSVKKQTIIQGNGKHRYYLANSNTKFDRQSNIFSEISIA
jgi:membrane-bound lytic murein transglycosylase